MRSVGTWCAIASSEKERPLQGVVRHDRCLRPRLYLLLQRAYPLGRLAQKLGSLAKLLLQRLGFYGYALQVIIDVLDVVAPQRLPEFDRPKAVEAGLLATRLGVVHVSRS